jgi:hypothetical protein
MLIADQNLANDDIGKRRSTRANDLFDLEAEKSNRAADFLHRSIERHIRPEPIERNFHEEFLQKVTKETKSLGRVSTGKYKTTNSTFERWHMEIYQQSHWYVEKLHITEELSFVDGKDLLNTFGFY